MIIASGNRDRADANANASVAPPDGNAVHIELGATPPHHAHTLQAEPRATPPHHAHTVPAELRAARLLARQRRQMAADVHDLVMQDLSLALATARALSDNPAAAGVGGVVSALERALAGAREVVSELTGRERRPLAQTVEASVRAAARHTPLRFDALVPPSAQADEPTREALVHIAREAVTNAVKHARPQAIEVVLERSHQWYLTVRDDGRGFGDTPAEPREAPGGFGLLSMRESARALGGELRVGSTAGVGTTVEAVLP